MEKKKEKIEKLNISEVKQEDTISVMASLNNRKIELPAEYAVLNDEEKSALETRFGNNFLPLENIIQMWQDKLREVSFKGNVSKLDLIAVTKVGVFRWENIKVYKHEFDSGRSVHVVYTKLPAGQRYNRRRGVRITIDRVMNVEQGGNIYSVIVRDISYCGVALIEPLGAQLNTKAKFILNFVDDNEDGEEYLVARLFGKINNQKEHDGGGVLSGCVLSPDHASFLQKYIATKQIESLRTNPEPGVTTNREGDFWKLDTAMDLKKEME